MQLFFQSPKYVDESEMLFKKKSGFYLIIDCCVIKIKRSRFILIKTLIEKYEIMYVLHLPKFKGKFVNYLLCCSVKRTKGKFPKPYIYACRYPEIKRYLVIKKYKLIFLL